MQALEHNLSLACAEGQVDRVRQLLSKSTGSHAGKGAQSGRTCLHTSVVNGHADVTCVLLDSKFDPNTMDNCGVSPLHCACYTGNMKIVTTLLEHDANVNAQDKGGCRPLMLAAQYGHVDVITALVRSRANVHEVDNQGSTALTLAASWGQEQAARLLISYGADPTHVDVNGLSTIDHARLNKHTSVMAMLEQAERDRDMRSMCRQIRATDNQRAIAKSRGVRSSRASMGSQGPETSAGVC
mmetsp:Transcript_26954/g.51360  ORF Transcript_26954/g.51360 Transcript_26954/m.51360 type:complete len:241 (+) Transcript_26954:172-894(+)